MCSPLMDGQVNFCKMNPYAMYLYHLLRDASIRCYSSILVFWSSFLTSLPLPIFHSKKSIIHSSVTFIVHLQVITVFHIVNLQLLPQIFKGNTGISFKGILL